jgi:hypothetical protein
MKIEDEYKVLIRITWFFVILINIVIILMFHSCSQEYTINSTCKESLIVGLYYSVDYKTDSTWAYFYDKSVFIGVGVYSRTGDVSREYKEYTVTGNDTINLRIENLKYYLRRM